MRRGDFARQRRANERGTQSVDDTGPASTSECFYAVGYYDGEQSNTLATSIAELLTRNLGHRDRRSRLVTTGLARTVAFYDPDTDLACTAKFEKRSATVYNGIAGRPSIVVVAAGSDLEQIPPRQRALRTLRRSVSIRRMIFHPYASLRIVDALTPSVHAESASSVRQDTAA